MRDVRNLLTGLLLFAVVVPVQAQVGHYTQKGFGAAANFQTGNDARTVGVDAAYVLNSLFEVGLGFSSESATCTGCDYSATYITPRVTVYVIREGESVPVTVDVGAHYHIISMSDAPDGYSASGWGASVGVSKGFTVSSLVVRPFGTFSYTGYTESYEVGGMSMDYSSNPIYYRLGALASTPMGAHTFFFGPFFEGWSEDGSSGSQVGVTAGIALGGGAAK